MDPITIALLAQAGIGAAKAGYGAWQTRQGRRQLDAAYEAPTGKPSEYADMIRQARASEIAQRRIDEINRAMGTSVAALQQGGSRALIGGIGAVTAAGSQARTQALSQQQSEIMQALQMSAMGAERERARQLERQRTEENRAMSAINAGAENIAGGLMDVASAGVRFGTASSQGLLGGSGSIDSSMATGQAQDEMFNQMASKLNDGARRDFTGLTRQELGQLLQGVDVLPTEGMEELEPLAFNKGGVQKTPGKFSHKSNPIDIMRDGAKIGEMTGGEYIFNPDQAGNLKKLSKSGNSDLHKFVRSLLNKPQFK